MTESSGPPVLVLGASAQVGMRLLDRLSSLGLPGLAVSRQVPATSFRQVTWLQHDLEDQPIKADVRWLLGAGPLRLTRQQASALPRLQRVIALSSASVKFKHQSPDAHERRLIEQVRQEEEALCSMAARCGFELTLLRPTLIYGGPGPSALDPIRNWLERHRWVPVSGNGLRQPVHSDDLAGFMLHLLVQPRLTASILEVGGGETLSYRDFLRRIGSSTGRHIRWIPLPAALVGIGLRLAHACGRLRSVEPMMVARQRMDLVVDDVDARALGWTPRPFRP